MDRFLKMGSKIGDNRKYVESSFVWNSRGGVKWRRKEEFNGARTTLEKMKERERGGRKTWMEILRNSFYSNIPYTVIINVR